MFQCQPAARTQMQRRRRDDGRQGFESRRARVQGDARARRPGSRAPDPRWRCRADWRRSGRSARAGTASNQQPKRQSMRANSSCRAFWAATSSACGEMSTPVTCQLGRSAAMASAMAPLPVPRSRTEHASIGRFELQRTFDQGFGFRPRHQHRGRHVERQGPKLAAARKIRDRRAVRAPRDQACIGASSIPRRLLQRRARSAPRATDPEPCPAAIPRRGAASRCAQSARARRLRRISAMVVT